MAPPCMAKAALELHSAMRRAAEALHEADALLICTGAGMGVDSGLGTFRGRHAGVWPSLEALGLDYARACSPGLFVSDPRLAWAFWCACYRAYTEASPHAGYGILARWGTALRHGFFSVTSNIDGHWARTEGVGPDRVYEVHGALTHLQCLRDDGRVWPADDGEMTACALPEWDLEPGEPVEAQVDVEADGEWQCQWLPAAVAADGRGILLRGNRLAEAHAVRRPGGRDLCRLAEGLALPRCPATGKPARPNVVMFGDPGVNLTRIGGQQRAFDAWKASLPEDSKLVILEVGAGETVSTIRAISEDVAASFPRATLVRINLDDGEAPTSLSDRAVSVGGLSALQAIAHLDAVLSHRSSSRGRSRGFSSAPSSAPWRPATRARARSEDAPGLGLSKAFLALLAELRQRQQDVQPAVPAARAEGQARCGPPAPAAEGAWLCTDEGGVPRGPCRRCGGCAALALPRRSWLELRRSDDSLPDEYSEEYSEEYSDEGSDEGSGEDSGAPGEPPCEACGCPAQLHRPLRRWLGKVRSMAQNFPSRQLPSRCRLPAAAMGWEPEAVVSFLLTTRRCGQRS